MRIVEVTSPNTQSLVDRGRVGLEFIATGTVGNRTFNSLGGKSYTFNLQDKRVQALRSVEADYLLGRWPSFFRKVDL